MESNELIRLAERLLALDPDPVVRLRLLRDVLGRSRGDPDLGLARDSLRHNPWVQQLAEEQWNDGSWGTLHTQDYAATQKVPTTEAGVERALALGLDENHPILRKAASYLLGVLRAKLACRDRPENNDRWETGVQLFAAAALAQIQPDLPALDGVWGLWATIARRTFSSGRYNAGEEIRAHRELTGASVEGSYLVIDNKYALNLLGSRVAALPAGVEAALVDWLWHKEDGIGYLREPLFHRPSPLKAGPVERWFASHELLARFPSWTNRAASVIDWLWEQRNDDGWWDFPSRSRLSAILPMSESWRKKGARQHDWTTRVLVLLRRYQQDDALLTLPAELWSPELESKEHAAPLAQRECYIIRRVRLAHCKRGPERCEKCREMDQESICLLDVCLPGVGESQRRVISVPRNGQRVWREFEIVRTFQSAAEARDYARDHGITDVHI